MSKLNLRKNNLNTSATQSFREASAEELRVLVALIELCGRDFTLTELAQRSAVSTARARAAMALWQAEGLFGEDGGITDAPEDNVRDEFPERFCSEMYEETALKTAKTVRDGELAELLAECAALMGKPALTTEEVKKNNLGIQSALAQRRVYLHARSAPCRTKQAICYKACKESRKACRERH